MLEEVFFCKVVENPKVLILHPFFCVSLAGSLPAGSMPSIDIGFCFSPEKQGSLHYFFREDMV